MHTPSNSKQKAVYDAAATCSPGTGVNTHNHVIYDDSDKMRYPVDSPVKKRVPWSPETAKMQLSPSLGDPPASQKVNVTRLLPMAPLGSSDSFRRSQHHPGKPPIKQYTLAPNRIKQGFSHTSSRAMLIVAVLMSALLPVTLHRVLYLNWYTTEEAREEVAHAAPLLNGLLRSSSNNNPAQRRITSRAAMSISEGDVEKMVVQQNKNSGVATSVAAKSVSGGSNESQRNATPAKYAYVYLVGGCDPANPAYRHFLYNIMVSTHVQRQEGSLADVIVLIQMSSQTMAARLPESDMQWLRRGNIQVRYVPTPLLDSFDQLMLDKLKHVMALTEYERVIFADADLLLRGSLDYLFRLTSSSADDETAVLAPNVLFAGRHQPALGGLFLVAPQPGDAERVQQLIDWRRKMTTSEWNIERGWGHIMDEQSQDSYELINGKKGRHWDFEGASADEGLLYHFIKYDKKQVSIIQRAKIENWGENDEGQIVLQDVLDLKTSVIGGKLRQCWATIMSHKPCHAPHSDYVHFPGAAKPWLDYPTEYLAKGTKREDSPHHFWWKTLQDANRAYELGLDFEHWKIEKPLLGLHANVLDVVEVKPNQQYNKNDSKKVTAAGTIEIVSPKITNIPTSPFAYAYVVGGCDPDKPAYRSFLQNILINTHLQRLEKSTADVVVFIQMAYHSKHKTLTDEDFRLLRAMNIMIEMVPKTENEGFDKIMLEKFRLLDLKQYERILYLDSDVMLRGSLDYFFHLSTQGKLKRNVIFADEFVPAAGSIFMVSPKEGDWDRVLELIREKEDRGENLPFPHWDEKAGWGHTFSKGDAYELLGGKKDGAWDFLGASSDLGLLYHWVKYEAKSVSIIMKDSVQNWDIDNNGKIHLESTLDLQKTFDGFGSIRNCWSETLKSKPCSVPHSDYVHFPSTQKPWLHSPPKDATDTQKSMDSPLQFWFYSLSTVNKKLGMGLKFSDWQIEHRPLLGMHPSNIETVVLDTDGKNKGKHADYAYAYVIGGVLPEDPAYVNYFYDIMINTYLQQHEGSDADVVVFIQMGYKSAFDRITDEDQRLLDAMNIKVQYIPKAEDESFYRIMLDKFLTLGLKQYKRVLFLDGDVMVRGNMDYLFHLSLEGVLKENVVFAGSTEPANGGTFMVAPKEGSWDRVLDIIHQKEERGAALPYPHFNGTIGWGHVVTEEDNIEFLNRGSQKDWDFYGGFADQGLLYHWTKYEEKSVSIFFRNEIQNWGANENGVVHKESVIPIDNIMLHKSVKPVLRDFCWRNMMKMKPCKPPHSDFIHFTGTQKPWLSGPPDNFGIASERESAKHYWFYVLEILNGKLNMKLDFNNWQKNKRPSLGLFPKHADVKKTSYASSAKAQRKKQLAAK